MLLSNKLKALGMLKKCSFTKEGLQPLNYHCFLNLSLFVYVYMFIP